MKIEQVEKNLINTTGIHYGQPIRLTNWEKNILNNFNNKIIIITDRKSGSTSFCKWLHYFKPTGKTYVISNNLIFSKCIKHMPIRLNKDIGKVTPTYDWMETISKNKFLKEGIKIYEDVEFKELGLIEDEIDFMIDNCWDVRVLNKVIECNPTLFTLSISRPLNSSFWDKEKNKDFFNWIEEIKKRDDTLVVIDKSINYTQINDAYVNND